MLLSPEFKIGKRLGNDRGPTLKNDETGRVD
jgi:hypothetical protein